MPREAESGWGVPLVAGLATFLLAALASSNAPGMGDSAELTLALALAGIAHPTGYPLYVLAGHFFVQAVHGLGVSWVMAADLWSATGAAVGVAAFARAVQHLVAMWIDDHDADRAPALAVATAVIFPVAALALDPVWMETASKAEVYSWSDAVLFLAAAFMMGRLRALGGPTTTAPGHDRRAAWVWGLLCGACGALHATSLLMMLPMTAALIAALAQRGRWRWSFVPLALVAALVPLSSEAWIAWRAAHPARFQWPVDPTFGSWWMHVRGFAYAHYLGRFSPNRGEWSLIRLALLPAILPGMVLGAWIALRARSSVLRWGLLALLLGAALQIAFIVSYSVPDPSAYFLPALMASLSIAAPLILWLGRRVRPVIVAAASCVVLVALGGWSLARVRETRAQLAQVDAGFRDAWRRIPFDRGIVLYADDHYHRFLVLQILEGLRPGLYVEDPDMLPWPARRRAFIRRFGFDPLEGLTFRTAQDLDLIPAAIRRRAKVPVLVLPE